MSSATILQHKYFPSYATLDMHLTRLLTLLLMELKAGFSPRKRSLGQLQQKIFDFSRGRKKPKNFYCRKYQSYQYSTRKTSNFYPENGWKYNFLFCKQQSLLPNSQMLCFHLISVSPLLTCFSTLKVNKLTWDTSNNHEKEINTQPRLGCDLWERWTVLVGAFLGRVLILLFLHECKVTILSSPLPTIKWREEIWGFLVFHLKNSGNCRTACSILTILTAIK